MQNRLDTSQENFNSIKKELKELTSISKEKGDAYLNSLEEIVKSVDEALREDKSLAAGYIAFRKEVKGTIDALKDITINLNEINKVAHNVEGLKFNINLNEMIREVEEKEKYKETEEFKRQLEELEKELSIKKPEGPDHSFLVAGLITAGAGLGLAAAVGAEMSGLGMAAMAGVSTVFAPAVTIAVATAAIIAIGVGIGMIVDYAIQQGQQEGRTR